jgi:hypothetical protein
MVLKKKKNLYENESKNNNSLYNMLEIGALICYGFGTVFKII